MCSANPISSDQLSQRVSYAKIALLRLFAHNYISSYIAKNVSPTRKNCLAHVYGLTSVLTGLLSGGIGRLSESSVGGFDVKERLKTRVSSVISYQCHTDIRLVTLNLLVK